MLLLSSFGIDVYGSLTMIELILIRGMFLYLCRMMSVPSTMATSLPGSMSGSLPGTPFSPSTMNELTWPTATPGAGGAEGEDGEHMSLNQKTMLKVCDIANIQRWQKYLNYKSFCILHIV